MKSIYLASPYGFSTEQREHLLPRFVAALESLGLAVHEPFSVMQQVTFARKQGWAYAVGQSDLQAVHDTDAIFAIVNGNPPEEGVMVELGVAIGLKKPTFLYRDDFRRSADCEEYPLNLMLFAGMPRENWRDYYFTSLDEIVSTGKALARWAEKP